MAYVGGWRGRRNRAGRVANGMAVPVPASPDERGGKVGVYAIVETGGKQHLVREGDTLQVEMLPAEVGQAVTLDRVLAVQLEDRLEVGRPFVDGARVTVKVVRHGRGPKIIVFKYKAKKNYRRKKGHRQPFTMVRVEKIEV